jgi:hypothetical protein
VPVPPLAEVLAFARDREVAACTVEIKNMPTDGLRPVGRVTPRRSSTPSTRGDPKALVIVQSFSPANSTSPSSARVTRSLLTLQPDERSGSVETAKGRGYEWISPGVRWAADGSRAHAAGLRACRTRPTPPTRSAPRPRQRRRADLPTNPTAGRAGARRRRARAGRDAGAALGDGAVAPARSARSTPIEAYQPRPGAPRVFAMQFKQDARHVSPT